MDTKILDHYFNSAKELPLTMPYNQIESLVNSYSIKGSKSWLNKGGYAKLLGIAVLLIGGLVTSLTLFNRNSAKVGNSEARNAVNSEPEPVKQAFVINTEQEDEVPNEPIPVASNNSKPIAQSINSSKPKVRTSTSVPKKPVKKVKAPVWWPKNNGGTGGALTVDSVKPFEVEGANLGRSPELNEPEYDSTYVEDSKGIDGSTKTIRKSMAINGINTFKLKHSYGKIEIKNSKSDSIILYAEVTIETNEKDEEQKALEDFDLKLIKEKKTAGIEVDWERFSKDGCQCYNSKTKVTTKDGTKIRVKKVRINYVLEIPKQLNLDLKSNYGNLIVPNTTGEVKAVVFQGNATIQNIENIFDIKLKYSNATLGDLRGGGLSLFQSNAVMGNAEYLDLSAKYSNLIWNKVEVVKVESFQSQLLANKNGNELSGSIKYGSFTNEGNLKQVNLNLFHATLKVGKVDSLKTQSSYSKLELDEVNRFEVVKSFQDKMVIEKLGSARGESSYTNFKIAHLGNSFELSSFQGKLKIDWVEHSFSSIKLTSKYTPTVINVAPKSSYHLKANTQYTKITLPNKKLETYYRNQQNSSIELKARYNVLQGKDAASNIEVNSFQGQLVIN